MGVINQIKYKIKCDAPKCMAITNFIDDLDFLRKLLLNDGWSEVNNKWFCKLHINDAHKEYDKDEK